MFRRLSTKYALSVAFLLSIVMLTVLVLAGRVVYQRTSDLRVELADSFSSAQAVNDVEALRASGVYLSNRLFNPLYRADISSLNEEIAQIHQWLAPRSILILDSEGRLVTDGSHENPRYREQISLPAGLQPSEPIVQNRSDGATLFFVIGFGGTTQGFARVELSNARRLEALRKLQAEVDTSWNGFESAFIDTALASLGVIALVSVVLGWRLSRSLSRPLSAMGQAAQEFAAGKLDHQLPEWSDDELGELARSLNDMARDLDKTSRLLTRTQEIAGLGSWEWRRQSATLTLSRGVYRILGSEPGAFEPTVNKLAEFTGASDREHLFSIMEGRYECPKSREIQIMRPDGTRRCVLLQGEPVLDTSERVTGYLGIIQDITEQRRSERQLETLANYDSLTRLPNRNLFYDRLRHAIQQAERRKSVVALLFLDLDGFKAINDALGHDIGDQLLQLVAERLDSVLRDCDTLARMGGDEFTVIVENVRDKSDLREVARKLIDSLSCGFDIQGRELIISTSIGIAMYPQDAQSIDNLIKIADAAMYAAKDDGKGMFRYFTAELDRNARARLSMEQELRRAIDCQDFELQFQPQIGTRTGRLVAVEVLLRWRRDGRLEAPATFMSVLEDTGLVTRLTRWVLQETCRWHGKLSANGLTNIRMAVNLSARQFQQDDLAELIDETLRGTTLSADSLELEITESTLLDRDSSQRNAEILANRGVRLAIDDFGTGYSSLIYLKRFHVDTLKVDRSFVRGMLENPDDAQITATVIGLAKGLGIRSVAEGVEHPEQLAMLREQGCDMVQGFLVSKSLTGPDLLDWARGQRILDSECHWKRLA